ncbi:DUF2461 domain-containing protein [uncultured Roseibium sp.]|uniref:DUF2461 domain-containing protein n=1 Tax=uncultured Roseibium sp. TaxID=1936171 RepID=UPI00260C5EF4|nr:DUF2461 domain-containing protein [uncultured Roseibium sp.]
MSAAGFSPETFAFLKTLAGNNTRDWFEANRQDYLRFAKKPADAVRSCLQEALAELTGREIASKQFRINRDLRFSKDKSPYNTHIRMAFWPKDAVFAGREAQPPGFFLSVETDHLRIGTGSMVFAKPMLAAYLNALQTGHGDEISALIARLEAEGFEGPEPDLAKVPKGFPRDHPHGELARHKGLALWKTLGDTRLVQGETAATSLLATWKDTLPFWKWLMRLQEKA